MQTKNKNDFYIYAHCKADTGEVFYIGKGRNRRMLRKDSRNTYWNNVVNKHGLIAKKLVENLSSKKALRLEIEFIKKYKDMGIELTNLTDGGEGTLNLSLESRQKKSLALKGKKRPPFSEEWKRNLSISHKGKTVVLTEEWKRNISLGKLKSSYRPTQETKDKISKQKGWKHTLEAIEKIRQASIKMNALRKLNKTLNDTKSKQKI